MTRIISTPYGADALDRLRDVVAAAKRDDPMAPVTVLVPNNLAGIVARRSLARGLADGRPGIAGLRVTTLPRLAEEIAAVGLAPRRPQTRTITAAAWRAALDEAPGVYAEVAGHVATIEALVRSHRELRDLDDDALSAVAEGGEVARDLVRLHRRVVDALAPAWYDETDLLHAAAELPDLDRRTRGAVVLHLPQVLSRSEQRLVATLAQRGDLTVVLGLTGVRRADGDVLAGFGEPVETARSIQAPTAHRVVSASDSDDEIRVIGRLVLADLADGVPAHRIAVLHSAAEPYARLLHERFAAMGVTVNGPGVRAVADRAVARLLLELLDLTGRQPGRDLPRTELFRALAGVPVRDFAGERIRLPQWERASREAGVVRGDDWDLRLARTTVEADAERRRLEQSDDPQQSRLDAIARRRDAAKGLRDFALELRTRLRDGERMTTWRELSAWALDLLQTLVPENTTTRMPPEEQYAASAVIGTLRALGGLDELEQHASLRALRDVLRIELDSTPPRVGTFGVGVLVAPVSAAIGLELDRAYVVGLTEDLYPGRIREDALLPDRVREAALDQLPRLRRRLDDRHRALLVAMQTATRVTVSVPRGDLRRSTHRRPSRWLLPTLRELADDHGLAMTDWEQQDYRGAVHVSGSFAGELLATTALADGQEWRTRAIAAGLTLGDPVVNAGTTMVDARRSSAFTRFDGDLSGVDGLPDLLTAEVVIAPTTLESYASCPHAYFMQRLLRVQPLEQPEDILTIRPLDVGSFLHESMDELATEGPLPQHGAPWTTAQRARLQQIALNKARAFERRGLTGHPRLWAVQREQLLHDLVRILDDDDRVRAERGATVIASELTFGMRGAEPVDIPVPGGRIRMKGSADRVDRDINGALVVIDMKTGSDRTYKQIVGAEDPFVGATKLQLPVYAHAARAAFGAADVRAEYWFVRRDMKRIDLPLAAIETDYAATLAVLARSIRDGRFPNRPPEQPDFRWVQCPYCNPDGIGHGDARERWERKRQDAALFELVSLIEPGTVID